MKCGSWLAVMLVNRNGERQVRMKLIIIIIMYIRVLSLMLHMTFPAVTAHNANASDNNSERTL